MNSSFSASNFEPYRVRPSDHVILKDDKGHETSDLTSNDVPAESAALIHISPKKSLMHSSY